MMDTKNIEAIYPLSPIQQGVLFHSTFDRSADIYFGQIGMTLQGNLNIELFARSWQKIIDRHHVLRTLFTTERQGKPMQIVLKSVVVPVQQLDWRNLSQAEEQEEMERFLKADRERGFDLEKAPLMRLTLIRLSEETHRLIWSEHHLLLDGWSVPLILNEFLNLYGSYQKGEDLNLPGARPYRDYIAWLGKQNNSDAEIYWRKLLKGFHTPTSMGIEHRTGEKLNSRNNVEEQAEVTAETVKMLQEVGRTLRLTMNTIVQGAWAVLLSRYGLASDLVYGATVSGRPAELQGVEGMVGPFINTLPVRIRINPEESMEELLRRMQAQQVETRQYEYSPLVEVQACSEMERGTPLFDSIFVFENYPVRKNASEAQGGLTLRNISAVEQSHFALAFVAGLNATLKLKVLYSRERFEERAISRMLGHFSNILESIVRNPGQQVSEVQLLTEFESNQILNQWNGTHTNFPKYRSVVDLFEEQASHGGSRIAVESDQEQLSYAELDQQSNQLARYLREKGVGPEQAVGICVDRGVRMIVGLLGILKAGGAYVPLDGNHPQARLKYMLEDSQVRVVVSEGKYQELLAGTDRELVLLDRQRAELSSAITAPIQRGVEGENLAYVLYTSGSTGKPKGVAVEHRSVVRLVKETNYLRFAADEVFLQFAPISFDASTLEIWGSLLNGARLVMFPPHIPTLAELAETIAHKGITTLWLTAGLFHQMVESQSENLKGLRQLIAGGDVLSVPCVEKVLDELPRLRLVNGYGPTENTTFTCCYTITAGSVLKPSVPIGVPVANTQTYILDSHLRLLPVGVVGELYIGGEGLARNYRNRPELTAERFIPNPFSSKPGERLYRTGDRARYRSDGNIEFLGRTDLQVKIRGFRIELEEIEAALSRHPAVLEAAVLVREGGNADKQLLACVVFLPGSELGSDGLRDFLKTQLPGYMVPTLFVGQQALPLTVNGKVDRKVLLARCMSTEDVGPSPKVVLTQVEEVLEGLWRELLGLAYVRTNEDFFQLGGHSLLAMQIASRIRDLFRVQLPMSAIFESPTIAGLASHIETMMRSRAGLRALPLQPVSRASEIPLSFAQQQLWFIDKFEPGNTAYNMRPAFRLRGPLNVSALERGINQLIARHESLRTTFPDVDGKPVQHIALPRDAALELVDLEGTAGADSETVQQALDRIALQPFDLRTGPLVRPLLVRLSETDHVLLLAMHHIVSDGGSIAVLFEELSQLYQGYSTGAACLLDTLLVQYADYAVWQREWLQGEMLESLLAYWKKQLCNAPAVMQFVEARSRPAVRRFAGKRHSWMIPSSLFHDMENLGRREGATKFMILLAAFYVLLRHYTSQDDLVVGTDVANRNIAATQRIVGFFINQLALRGDLSGNPTFRELLGRVRQTALDAYAHHELPFERLVDGMRAERHWNCAPVFQTKLIFQPHSPGVLQLPGIEIEPFRTRTTTSSLDLLLALLETTDGLMGTFEYDTDLFDDALIGRMANTFETLLVRIVTQPDTRLKEMEIMLDDVNGKQRQEELRKRDTASLSKLRNIKPRATRVQPEELVRTGILQDGAALPFVLEPAAEEVDLPGWLTENREFISTKLLERGAILFHSFKESSIAGFEDVAAAVCAGLYKENGEHPRESVSGNVYTPTFYPSDKNLLWHNENSFNHTWPGKILFCCVQPAERGGETPIVDSRRVFKHIPARIRNRFMEKGVMYARNYGTGVGLDWQTVFQTHEPARVEALCRESLVDFEWKSNGSLQTRAVRPACVQHETTGEWSWFNQAQHWHLSCLDASTRESISSLFHEDDYPRNCYYGDGSPIEESVMSEILDVYRRLEVTFPWQRGDIMLLDNVLVAHARNAYAGPRKLLVAMGELHSYSEMRFASYQ